MVNQVKIIRNDSTGEPVILHATGQTAYGVPASDFNNGKIAFHDAMFGELTNGTATLILGNMIDGDNFTFTLDTHDSDNGVAGATAYAELKKLTDHTTYAHGEVVEVNDPLVERIKLLEAQILKPAKVYDTAHLSMFYNDAGEIVGHEWQLSMRGANDTLTARNAHFIDIENQPGDAPPQLVIRYYDNKRRIVDEARATISTNDFAGWRFVLNGRRLPRVFSGAEAYTLLLLAENPPSGESSGDASGDSAPAK